MEGNSHASASAVFINFMAPALTHTKKAVSLEHGHDFFCAYARQLFRHIYLCRNLNTPNAHRPGAWHEFAIRHPILHMEPNRVFDILQRLLIGITLAVAPLQFRTTDKIAVFVLLYDNGKLVGIHKRMLTQTTEK